MNVSIQFQKEQKNMMINVIYSHVKVVLDLMEGHVNLIAMNHVTDAPNILQMILIKNV